MSSRSRFSKTAKATNALATATETAVTGKRHVITVVSASYEAAAIGLLQIKDGVTVIWEHFVHNQIHLEGLELQNTKGAAISAELAASGSVGVDGAVNIQGFTERA